MTENNLPSGYIRPLVFIGNVGLGVRVPDGAKAQVMVGAIPWGAYLGEEGLSKGIKVCTSSFNRFHVNSTATRSKTCGNYVASVLAKREAVISGYDEALFLDTEGYVAEGSGENVFVVKNGRLITTPMTSILRGITRDSIITLARDLGYEVVEESLTRERLYFADEVFFTGTAAEVTPIRSVDGKVIGAGKRGPVAEELQKTFFDIAEAKKEDKFNWLTYI